MIRLRKGPIPNILKKNGAAWLAAIKKALKAGKKPTAHQKSRYRHKDIKAALVKETYGKCAYCESKLLHITYGDVEHITPKSLDVNQLFRWPNLTLACDVCNTQKGSLTGLIDPYKQEPQDSLIFMGRAIFPKPGDSKALDTITLLDLNRDSLLDKRDERIVYITGLLNSVSGAATPATKKILARDIIKNDISESSEFAALSKMVVDRIMPELYDLAK